MVSLITLLTAWMVLVSSPSCGSITEGPDQRNQTEPQGMKARSQRRL